MEAELAQTRDRASFLENELEGAITRTEELEAQLLAGASTQESNQRLQESVLAKNRDIEALESEVERLQQELDASIKKGREASQAAESNSKQQKRPMLSAVKWSDTADSSRSLSAAIAICRPKSTASTNASPRTLRLPRSNESRVDDLENRGRIARREADALRAERDEQTQAMEDLLAQGDVKDLRNEIEGLKERLRLAKDRSRNEEHLEEENRELKESNDTITARVAELEGEMDVLREQIDAAGQPPEPGAAVSGLSPEVLVQLVDRVDALDRIVDAIVRADLDPLSTVDRVRLQSAIRDTEPKKSLLALKALLTSDQSE